MHGMTDKTDNPDTDSERFETGHKWGKPRRKMYVYQTDALWIGPGDPPWPTERIPHEGKVK